MIDWRLVGYPVKEIYAVCQECNTEVVRKKWDGYIDFKHWQAKLQKQYTHCPVCTKRNAPTPKKFPKWEKLTTGDYMAKCLNGDFLIWKYGNAYKWRYRDYGRENANCVGFASTLDIAKKACEKHEKWEGV